MPRNWFNFSVPFPMFRQRTAEERFTGVGDSLSDITVLFSAEREAELESSRSHQW